VPSGCYLQPESEDELKKRQLMELALLNGTYRGFHSNHSNILAAARLNNNNTMVAVNNNHNNNNNIGLLMMAAGPPFCKYFVHVHTSIPIQNNLGLHFHSILKFNPYLYIYIRTVTYNITDIQSHA